MNKETIMRYAVPAAAVAASIGIGFAGITAAQTTPTTSTNMSGHNRMFVRGERPAVVGKVTAINGTTLTVLSMYPMDDSSTATTYTVDASNAKVSKGVPGSKPTTSSVGAIVVGDMVAVRGSVSGANVTATEIIDGIFKMRFHHEHGMMGEGVGGTVTAISRNTITLTGKDGKTYTIDASSATIDKITQIPLSQIAVGDQIGAMGVLSGENVTAKHILDGMPPMREPGAEEQLNAASN